MLMSPDGGVDGVNDYVNDDVVDSVNGYGFSRHEGLWIVPHRTARLARVPAPAPTATGLLWRKAGRKRPATCRAVAA